ncbi:MAG: hypothetical protein ACJ8DC_13205 [Gemmatimonadales bacterium]
MIFHVDIKALFDLGFHARPEATSSYDDALTIEWNKKFRVNTHVPAIALLVLGVAALLTVVLRYHDRSVYPSPGPATWLILGAVLTIAGVGVCALLTGLLRSQKNPLPWQLACWTLLTIGVLSRHLLLEGGSGTPFDVKSLLLSAAIGLAVFPYAMRRLNQLRPDPGLEHVAVPFGLGFFLDIAQVTALHWLPKLTG